MLRVTRSQPRNTHDRRVQDADLRGSTERELLGRPPEAPVIASKPNPLCFHRRRHRCAA